MRFHYNLSHTNKDDPFNITILRQEDIRIKNALPEHMHQWR